MKDPVELATILAEGLIAGASIQRSIVELPAFGRLGAPAWAAYSRNADLRNGRFWYPTLAIASTALAIVAAIRRRSLWPSAALAAAGLLSTVEAGPNVLRVRHDDRPSVVQRSFQGFRRWQAVRATLQGLAFVAGLAGSR